MELLRRFAQGDLAAFEALFRQFQAQAYRWIARIVRDPGVAEDLTVETFWRIYRARSRFNPERNFGAWVRRIATNLALDHLRTKRPEVEMSELQLPMAAPNAVNRPEIHRAMRHAFELLTPKLRVVATLALIEEERNEDIADALGIGVEVVKTRKFRAVRQLRKSLKRMGIES